MFDRKAGGELCALWKLVTPSWLGGHIPLAIHSCWGSTGKGGRSAVEVLASYSQKLRKLGDWHFTINYEYIFYSF